MNKVILAICFIFTLPLTAMARPKAIILLRHAEEPKEDVNHLSAAGYARAKMLPKLFKTHPALKKLDPPIALFAAGAKKEDSSIRSIETLHNLSLDIEVPINDTFKRDDFRALAKEINTHEKYDDQVVVVVWQHKILREIAEKLGVKKTSAYPSDKFDRIWLITYKKDKANLEDLPQNLMPGDDKK